jgi:gluconokinase
VDPAAGESQLDVELEEAAEPLVLALDIGTSSARAIVYDARGVAVRGAEAHRPFSVQTTLDGGVTIDADMLLENTARCIDEVLPRVAGRSIGAVAADTFWHSVMGTDERGHTLTPIFTWADTRSRHAAAELRYRLDEDAVHARTGCVLHSSYVPAKLLWLGETQPDVVRSVRFWMSFAEYLYWTLFGDRRVSLSMASATGLFQQNACVWDEEILAALSVEASQLSPLAEFTEVMQGLREPYRTRWAALADLPWYLALGDGACNNVGSGGYGDDQAVAMVGTSGAIRVVHAADRVEVPPGLFAYRVDRERFVLGGALSDGGNVFAWLTHTLRVADVEDLEQEVATLPPDAHGLTVLPFLAGERSPDWNPDARAVLLGMTLATRPVDVVQAALEAVAYRFGVVYDVLRQNLPGSRSIIGSGAALIHSPVWQRMMTDVLGEPMSVSSVPEASSRGAALLVLENLGAVRDLHEVPVPLGERHVPDQSRREVYLAAMARQQELYSRLLGT